MAGRPEHSLDDVIHGEMAPGFLGLLLGSLVDRLVEEGVPSAARAGISAPVRAFSMITLLSHADLSVTEIAPLLGVTHAGAIKTARALEGLGLVERGQDPDDARRRPLCLTGRGRAEAEAIAAYMRAAGEVYRGIFEETGTDLFAAATAFRAALERRGFDARMQAVQRGRG
jgi:DNA-binding MarR family transcriptional regulator